MRPNENLQPQPYKAPRVHETEWPMSAPSGVQAPGASNPSSRVTPASSSPFHAEPVHAERRGERRIATCLSPFEGVRRHVKDAGLILLVIGMERSAVSLHNGLWLDAVIAAVATGTAVCAPLMLTAIASRFCKWAGG